MLTWVVSHVRTYELGENDGTMTKDGRPIIAEIPHAEWIDVTIPLAAESANARVYAFDLNGEVKQLAHFEVARGDIKKGDKLGVIELQQDGEVIDTIDLVAAKNSPRPSMIRGLFIGVERFFRNLHGESIVAEQVSHFENSKQDDDSDADDEESQEEQDGEEAEQEQQEQQEQNNGDGGE
jgi:D-alanyl-D-alanine carboxypeptidase (penicillin-binding protein 5/6)